MKVLINTPRLVQPGGVANMYRILRQHLEPTVEYFEVGATPNEVNIVDRLVRTARDYRHFHRKISSKGFTLVHLNPSLRFGSIVRDALFLLIARSSQIPVLVFFHGWNDEIFQKPRTLTSRIFQLSFKEASGIVVLAEQFRKQLYSLGFRSPVFKLTPCVDDSIFRHSIPNREPSLTRILYLSRLDHGKGVIEAIKIFAKLKRKQSAIQLAIAGDGPLRKTAELYVEKQGISGVTFVGHIEGQEKYNLFVGSDIYLFPTFLPEGLPTTVLEAMAFGLPVVTRTVGGLNDFFEHGQMGFATDGRSIDIFVGYLEQLLSDTELRHRISRHNRQFANENFSASKVAFKLMQIYAEVQSNPYRKLD